MIIGSELIFVGNAVSTNTLASELIHNNKPREGTIIHTNHQSHGKGQQGNRWESEDGKNLLFTIILYPGMILPGKQFLISMALSLGICDFLKGEVQNCSIKWPNDIYVSGKKIAGILIENSISGNSIRSSIAGIGLNVNQVRFPAFSPEPVSMSMITRRRYDTGRCLSLLASQLDKRYKQLIAGQENSIRDDYISRLYRYLEQSRYRDHTGEFTGRIISVTEQGLLRIEKEADQIQDYGFREIEYIH
ncbi:MAG: biotin--[acetyl-CoA-carboxylase] ligase [Bacteroidales bacterium]|nr:biotin--[acetyl-CoA-carboxylase] ligase [Bacteroidales bacterium]